jgi:hypothetical protein
MPTIPTRTASNGVTLAASAPVRAGADARVLPDLSALVAEMERLKAENAKLASLAAQPRKVSFKVTEKGGLSMYGLGRFPVTLYRSQWELLLSHADDIRAAIDRNASALATKDQG